MFLMVSERKCPFCGIEGKVWRRKPKIFICPNCNALYNHFGVLLEGEREKPELM